MGKHGPKGMIKPVFLPIQMPGEMHARLCKEAKKADLSMNDLVRTAIRNLFKEIDRRGQ